MDLEPDIAAMPPPIVECGVLLQATSRDNARTLSYSYRLLPYSSHYIQLFARIAGAGLFNRRQSFPVPDQTATLRLVDARLTTVHILLSMRGRVFFPQSTACRFWTDIPPIACYRSLFSM